MRVVSYGAERGSENYVCTDTVINYFTLATLSAFCIILGDEFPAIQVCKWSNYSRIFKCCTMLYSSGHVRASLLRRSMRNISVPDIQHVVTGWSNELRSLRSMVRSFPVRSLPTKSHFSHALRTRNILGRLSGANSAVLY